MQRVTSSNKEGSNREYRKVMTYVKYVAERRLKQHTPGLLLSLNMYTYGKYGKFALDLLTDDPYLFYRALMEYFGGNQTMAERVMRYVLKPVIDSGSDGRRAVDCLISGELAAFKEYVVKALHKQASKWLKD